MEISRPNEHGILASGHTQLVAQLGRSHAEVRLALGEDGRYRYGLSLRYSYGGFSSPISTHDEGFADVKAATTAGMEELLRRWPRPFPSDPQSVHDELHLLREQIESQLRQPSLF